MAKLIITRQQIDAAKPCDSYFADKFLKASPRRVGDTVIYPNGIDAAELTRLATDAAAALRWLIEKKLITTVTMEQANEAITKVRMGRREEAAKALKDPSSAKRGSSRKDLFE